MSKPASLLLPDDVHSRLNDESCRVASAPSTLAVAQIDEGLRMRRFPGIVFRDGPTGRRAGLANGPDVWEVVRDLKMARGADRQPVDVVAEETGLAIRQVDLAADYYAAFPDEIDSRIATDARVAEELRSLANRRQRLL